MTLCDQIRTICVERGLSVYRIEKDCGFGNGSIMKWETSSPKVENVIKLADYFEVSVDYLLGREIPQTKKAVPMERPQMVLAAELPDLLKEKRFVDTAKIYNALPDQYRERVFSMVMGIAIGLGINTERILGR